MKETTNLHKLHSLLVSATGLDTAKAERFVQAMIEYISDLLTKEKTACVPGLGIFRVDSEADDIVFEPDRSLADAVNGPFSFFEAVELEVEPDALEDMPKEDKIIETGKDTNTDIPDIDHSKINGQHERPIELHDELHPENLIDLAEAADSDQDVEETRPEQPHCHDADEYENEDPQTIDFIEVTRWWPVIAGVVAGLVTGIILGWLSYNILFGQNGQPSEENSNHSVNRTIDSARIKVAHVDSLHVENLIADEINDAPSSQEKQIVTDTVTTTHFLATMARKYYGVMEYWIYIYEENKDRLPSNPNKIRPGTVVVIPPIDKYVSADDKARGKSEAAKKIAELERRLQQKS